MRRSTLELAALWALDLLFHLPLIGRGGLTLLFATYCPLLQTGGNGPPGILFAFRTVLHDICHQ